MKARLGYYLFLIFSFPFSFLPFWIHRRVADFISFFLRKVMRYRVDVVSSNLKNAFPEKSDSERAIILKDFYRNMSDIITESLKLMSISEDTFKKHLFPKDVAIVDEYLRKGQSIILATGHYANWEFASGLALYTEMPSSVLYRPLHNKHIDQFIRKNRGRTGFELISIANTARGIKKKEGTPHLFAMIADQNPVRADKAHWTEFLNQDTAFLYGIAKYAKKHNYPVVFGYLRRTSRSYYEVAVEPLVEDPSQFTEEEITILYAQRLERLILEDPAQWLWSHKRWKHTRS